LHWDSCFSRNGSFFTIQNAEPFFASFIRLAGAMLVHFFRFFFRGASMCAQLKKKSVGKIKTGKTAGKKINHLRVTLLFAHFWPCLRDPVKVKEKCSRLKRKRLNHTLKRL
jgi:hypothetical protein